MPTPNLQITHISASQDQKEVTANEALDDLDNAMNGSDTKTINGNDTLTTAEARENAVIILQAGSALAAGFTLDMPDDNKRRLVIVNLTGQTCTVQGSSPDSADNTVDVTDGNAQDLYFDGTDIRQVAPAVTW